jgi:hypothetical protein
VTTTETSDKLTESQGERDTETMLSRVDLFSRDRLTGPRLRVLLEDVREPL